MDRKGNCWNNAPPESFYHSLKTDEDIRTAVDRICRSYERYLQSALNDLMPELAEITYSDGEKVFPDPNTILYRFRPEVISILDFSKGFGHADLVLLDADDTAE